MSALSNYKREINNYSSVSPSRTTMGLAPINHKDKIEALDNISKEWEEIYRVKKEFRTKEHEYNTKIALYEQKIELLEIHIKEADDKETSQK